MSRTLSTRVGKETEEELRFYMRTEKVDKATATRKLLERGVRDWRRETAIAQLREGKVTVWRAAEIAEMPLWDFVSLIEERKVPLMIKGRDVLEDLRTGSAGKS